MKDTITNVFTDAILADGARRFGVRAERSGLVGDHQAFVFRGTDGMGRNVALRFAHQSHRSPAWIEAEMDWVEYLASHDVPVARPLRSSNGKWSECVGQDDEFIASCSRWAAGRPPRTEDLTPLLFETLGKVLGRMHRVTEAFVPTNGFSARPHWYELDSYNVRGFVPSSQEKVYESADSIFAQLNGLEQSPSVYGLIHSSLHLGNVFLDGRSLTCFDFDSCQYNWLGYDIASVLFFTARQVARPVDDLQRVLKAILYGYAKENDTRRLLLNHLELFLSVREITKYILYYKQDRVETASEERRDRIQAYRFDIEHRRPFLGIDWNQFSY